MTIILRDYQQALEDGIYRSWQTGNRNVLAVLPTGGGKTRVKASIFHKTREPSTAIAHRQELVGQISMALADTGTYHRIIAPDSVIRFCIGQHVRKHGHTYHHPSAPVAVGGVDTIIAREDSLKQWCNQNKIWDIDECFPAGTPVTTPCGAVKIESLRVGDTVTAFDETTGAFAHRRIVRLFKNPIPRRMVTVTAGKSITATGGHPFWTKRGWVEAKDLTTNDFVQSVRPSDTRKKGDVLGRMPSGCFVADNVPNQSRARIVSNENPQSDAQGQQLRENASNPVSDESSAKNSRRERQGSDSCGSGPDSSFAAERVCLESRPADREAWNNSDQLQIGHCAPGVENCNRSGRGVTRGEESQNSRFEKDFLADWQRVESVTIHEFAGDERPSGGFVYNIEVDGLHTYVAGGFIVHNCHHVLRDNKWGKAVAMFPNAWGVGFTATPLRADRKSLGAGRSGVFHDMIVGPSMRELIRRGYLADYRIFAPPGSIDVSHVPVSDATGDYNQTALRREAHKSTITGDVVEHYLRFAPGKRGITFAVDVEMATATAEAFRNRGVTAEVVSAKTPDIVRSSVIERFAAGNVLQLVNVDLFGEGFDVPACEVVSMARPTKSYGLYVQQFGRALRPFSGKTHGIILDHVENVKRHGFPDKPRVWNIEADETKRASRPTDDMIPITCCVACFFPYEKLTKTCPHCGHVDEPISRGAPEFVDGDLVEFSPELLARLRGDADAAQESPYTDHLPNQAAVLRYRRLHSERAEAQRVLRETIDFWAGVEHAAHDYSHSALYRLFYHTFGIDVLSAQSLNRQDTEKLTALIRERLT